MNRFLSNLVMVLAFALCGLCVFQWKREGNLNDRISTQNDDLYKKKETIQSLEVKIRQDKENIDQLDQARKDLTEVRVGNEKTIGGLTNELDRVIRERDGVQKQLDDYKKALDSANDSIRRQNEDVKKLNDLVKSVAQQRDDKAAEYSKLAEEYNKVVKEYNKLVDDVNKMNAAATNATASANPDKKK